MKHELAHSGLNSVHDSIVNTVLYYDVFNYPLKAQEVFQFLRTNHTTPLHIEEELKFLADKGLLFQFGEFFSAQNNETLIPRRLKGNREAEIYLAIARKKAKLIACFPFVRAVLASGSLSKGYMDENSDLDFFIITHPGRLWIARTLLVLYKRIFLFGSHKYFCVNYFIDSDHLELEEKNLFTATELATVIPLQGMDMYQKLLQQNDWLLGFFPNFKSRSTENISLRSAGFKKVIEKVLDVFQSDALEKYFMSLTQKRWNKLYAHEYSKPDFQVAFKTKKHASKNHPRHYQKKVIQLHDDKVQGFMEKFKSSFNITLKEEALKNEA